VINTAIVNVVATAALNQEIDLYELENLEKFFMTQKYMVVESLILSLPT